MNGRIRALFETFNVYTTPLDPSNGEQLERKKRDCNEELSDLTNVAKDAIHKIEETVLGELEVSQVTRVSKIEEALLNIHRQREIYKARLYVHPSGGVTGDRGQIQTNKNSLLEGHVWVPTRAKDELTQALDDLKIEVKKDGFIAPVVKPADRPGWKKPTSFLETDLTMPFNMAVQTYSVPMYGEINPGLFTVSSFPFLFGVMFGDFGHGLCLMTAGLILMCKANKMKAAGGMSRAIAELRYMFVLMGFFATYCGLIYNEFFAVALPWPGSCYEIVPKANGEGREYKFINTVNGTDTPDYGTCVFPFGLDYAWGAASNEVLYFNSLKMKLSVILGITHMSLGIFLKGANAIYFKSAVDFICEFIPQLVFFVGIFGYMMLLIFMKWLINWTPVLEAQGNKGKVPQIIATFSQIYTNPADTKATGKLPIIGYTDYDDLSKNPSSTQYHVQLALLGIAFVMIILMLVPKPFIVNSQNKKRKQQHQVTSEAEQPLIDGEDGEMQTEKKADHGGDGHHDEPFGELMIHQLIETIEFVLGSISNTASYLR